MTLLLLSAIIAVFAVAIAVIPAVVILVQSARLQPGQAGTVTQLDLGRDASTARAA